MEWFRSKSLPFSANFIYCESASQLPSTGWSLPITIEFCYWVVQEADDILTSFHKAFLTKHCWVKHWNTQFTLLFFWVQTVFIFQFFCHSNNYHYVAIFPLFFIHMFYLHSAVTWATMLAWHAPSGHTYLPSTTWRHHAMRDWTS